MSTSTVTPAGRPRFRPKKRAAARYHHGDLRRALIDAALHLIERRGPDGLTLREAARLVGVSHAAVYRHFSDKTALLRAVATEGVAGMRDAMQAAVAGVADPVEAFQRFGVAYVLYAVEHPAHFRVMYGPEADCQEGPLAEAKEEKMGMLIAGVEACQRAGVFPAGPPEPLAVVAWSLVHGLATLWVDGVLQRTTLPAGDPRAAAEMVTRTMLGVFRNA
jgi:AcrR family transcriptional regulator